MTDLKELRDEIDVTDKKIVELFERRMEIVADVIKYKLENNIPVLNSLREAQVIEKNINYLKNKDLGPYLENFYKEIMNLSKEYQKLKLDGNKPIKNVCFQGSSGSYSEEALYEYFGLNVKTYQVKEFEDVFINLRDQNIDYGVLPIENSSTGPISEVYDLLRKYGLYIVGNMTLKIDHNLMAIKEAEFEDVRTVYSHSQGLKQCSKFLKDKNFELVAHSNTAVSAELVREKDIKTIAAIASKKAALANGLKILKDNINDDMNNYTRFIIIGNNLETCDTDDAISIVFSNPNKIGLLYDSLEIFKKNDLNMTRIESRPIVGKPWEYFFYIDFEGHRNNIYVEEAIDYIRNNSSYFKLLGTYKK